jgi:N-acetylmuramoyl-L-alanine amidase
VECGFLTNPGEKSRLLTDAYQNKMAWSIYLGIVDYFRLCSQPGAVEP